MSFEQPYLVRYVRHNIPSTFPAGCVRAICVVVENRGAEPWPLQPHDGREVGMAVFQNDRLLTSAIIDRDRIAPGARGVAFFTFQAPAAPGICTLKIDMVRQGVAMFEQLGNVPLRIPITITDVAGRTPWLDRLRSRAFMAMNRDLPLVALGIRWQVCRLAFTLAPRRSRMRSRALKAWKSVNETMALREQLARRTRLRSLPPHLIVDSTVRCNLRCRLCVRQGHPKALDLRHDLPRELLERVVASLFPTARDVNLSLIGEPLLTPHLSYLLDAMETHGVGLNLITNGTLLDRPIVQERVVPLLRSLEVSLDSTDPALSTRLRAGGDHELVLANVRAMAAVRRSLPAPAFAFGLSVTLTSLNLAELPKLISLAAELGCTYVRGSFCVIFGRDQRELSVLNVPERYNEISVIARERALACGVPLSIPDPIEICADQESERGGIASVPGPVTSCTVREAGQGDCPFLYSIGCVDHRGRLTSCLHHEPPLAVPIGVGNIRAFRNRAQLRDLRRDHDTALAHRSCRECFIIRRGPKGLAELRRQFLPSTGITPVPADHP